MPKALPIVRCPKCHGGGWIDLPKSLRETLAVLKGRQSPCEVHYGVQLRFASPIGVTAICNRLEKLRAHGLVERQAEGSGWTYFKT